MEGCWVRVCVGVCGCDLNIGESGNGSERILTDRVHVRAMCLLCKDGLKKITFLRCDAKDRMSERGDERKECFMQKRKAVRNRHWLPPHDMLGTRCAFVRVCVLCVCKGCVRDACKGKHTNE